MSQDREDAQEWVYVDENGNVVDENGQPVDVSSDPRFKDRAGWVYLDDEGNHVDERGQPVAATGSSTSDSDEAKPDSGEQGNAAAPRKLNTGDPAGKKVSRRMNSPTTGGLARTGQSTGTASRARPSSKSAQRLKTGREEPSVKFVLWFMLGLTLAVCGAGYCVYRSINTDDAPNLVVLPPISLKTFQFETGVDTKKELSFVVNSPGAKSKGVMCFPVTSLTEGERWLGNPRHPLVALAAKENMTLIGWERLFNTSEGSLSAASEDFDAIAGLWMGAIESISANLYLAGENYLVYAEKEFCEEVFHLVNRNSESILAAHVHGVSEYHILGADSRKSRWMVTAADESTMAVGRKYFKFGRKHELPILFVPITDEDSVANLSFAYYAWVSSQKTNADLFSMLNDSRAAIDLSNRRLVTDGALSENWQADSNWMPLPTENLIRAFKEASTDLEN